MIKKLLLCFSLLLSFSLYTQEIKNKKNWLSTVRQVSGVSLEVYAKMYAYSLGAAIATTYAHEYGHALAAHYFFKVPSTVTVSIDWNPFLINGLTTYSATSSESYKQALIALAGPAAGLAACWAMLKMNTFVNCYLEKRNKLKTVKLTDEPESVKASVIKEGWSVLSALNKTFNKMPFMNHHQSPELQLALVLVSAGHMSSLIHSQNSTDSFSSDGDIVAQSIFGQSLGKCSPEFSRKLELYSIMGWIFAGCGSVLFSHWHKRLGSALKASFASYDGKNPYEHFTLEEAKRALAKRQGKHLLAKFEAQGKKILLAQHIAHLES